MEKDNLSRKLAVILHADVVGSTALVQQNETLTHKRIQTAFQQFSKTIDSYNGKTHELRGDALVAEFGRSSDAVAAALAFQALNEKTNSTLDDEIQPQLRIGISLGEVIIADNTITGAGIVLAQRLEQLAEPGGIVVQGSVSETVPARFSFEFESLGEQLCKGFDQPVRAFVVKLQSGGELPAPETIDSPLAMESTSLQIPDKPSIAVLPFENMSGDPEQEYFSDGIAEDIITELSRYSNLFVISRNSSFKYRGENADTQRIAHELGVQYMLGGSVRKGGNRVRVNVQLVDSLSQNQVWADRFDRQLDDIFSVQDEIVEQAVTGVAGQVTFNETRRRKHRPTNSMSAYDYYLRGLQVGDFGTYSNQIDNWLQAKDHFEQAIALDPDYVDAMAELSWVYVFLSYFGFNSEAGKSEFLHASEHSREYAERAVSLDGGNATGHAALGYYHLDTGNHDKSLQHFEKAIRLNPNSSRVLGQYAMYLGNTGQTDNAIAMVGSAIRLDPHPPEWLYDALGEICWLGGRYQQAISAFNKLMHKPFWVYPDMAASYACLGNMEEARRHVEYFNTAIPDDRFYKIELDYNLTRLKYESDREHLREGWRKAGLLSR